MRYKKFVLPLVAVFALASAAPALAYSDQDSMSNYQSSTRAQIYAQLHAQFKNHPSFKNFKWWWKHNHNNGGGQSDNHFKTSLTGAKEVPPVSTNMSGELKLDFKHPGDTGKFELKVWNGDDVTAAHLHCAPAGQNGPVVVGLYDNAAGGDIHGVLATGEITDSKVMAGNTPGGNCPVDINDVDDLEDAIEDGFIYVNVHTKDYPNGEIRGQL